MSTPTVSLLSQNDSSAVAGQAVRRGALGAGSSGVAPQDRRRHPRLRARGLASHLQTSEAYTGGLSVENISMGGLFVRCAAPLPLGMAVTVQLVRPGLKKAIRMSGRVVSVVTPALAGLRGSVPGIGIGIDGLDSDTEERLRALLETLVAPACAA